MKNVVYCLIVAGATLLSIACNDRHGGLPTDNPEFTVNGFPKVDGQYLVKSSNCPFASVYSTFAVTQADANLSISLGSGAPVAMPLTQPGATPVANGNPSLQPLPPVGAAGTASPSTGTASPSVVKGDGEVDRTVAEAKVETAPSPAGPWGAPGTLLPGTVFQQTPATNGMPGSANPASPAMPVVASPTPAMPAGNSPVAPMASISVEGNVNAILQPGGDKYTCSGHFQKPTMSLSCVTAKTTVMTCSIICERQQYTQQTISGQYSPYPPVVLPVQKPPMAPVPTSTNPMAPPVLPPVGTPGTTPATH